MVGHDVWTFFDYHLTTFSFHFLFLGLTNSQKRAKVRRLVLFFLENFVSCFSISVRWDSFWSQVFKA